MPPRRIPATGGLATDPSALDQPASLRTADNLLLHRPGIIGPRFGLGDTTGVTARSVSRRPIAIVPFGGGLAVQSFEAPNTWSLERASDTTVISTDVKPADVTLRGVSSFAQARGSLYLTTDDGVKKLEAIASTALDLAGVATEFHTLNATLTAVFASASAAVDRYAIKDDGAAAYRYVWRRQDANAYTRRSAPSSRFVVTAGAASGGPWNAEFSRLSLPPGVVAGDFLELYRTKGVTPLATTPGREYYLALEYQVTAADVAAGYIAAGTLFDDTPDSALGGALYTNPSQGGTGQANEVPPVANSLAWWGDVMWYANTTSRHALEVELVNIGNATSAHRSRTGLVSHALTGSFTNASAAFSFTGSGPSSPYGFKVGQYVSDAANGPTAAGTNIQALTTVTTLTTSILVNNAALVAGDTITVFGETWTWALAAANANEITMGATSILSAGNLATKLDGWDFADLENVSASNGGTATVTASEVAYGLCVEVSVTGTGQTITYAGTMSKTATATNAGVAIRSHDFVTVNSVLFFAGVTGTYGVGAGNSALRMFGSSNSSGDFNSRIATTLDSLAHAINGYTLEQDATFGVLAYRDVETSSPYSDNAGDSYLTLIRSTMELGTFSFSCAVRPDAFRPNTGTAGQVTSVSTRARSRLHWSKINEPEAVPTLNFLDIGDRARDILALAPIENALLVFKEDGIFAVRGSAPSSWVVDEVDLSQRLVAPQAVCTLNGVCYAWTNRGVIAVTEGGAQVISGVIGDKLRELQRLLPVDDANTKRGYWMTAHDRHGLVMLGTGSAAADTATDYWFVFATSTQRWSRWPIASRCAAYDPAQDRMVHSPEISAWSLLYERSDEDSFASYKDASFDVACSISGTVATIAQSAFGGFVPAVGDLIAGIQTQSLVTAVATSGSDYLLTLEQSHAAAAAVGWWQGYACIAEWQAQHLPGISSRWTEAHAEFQAVRSFRQALGGVALGTPVAIGGITETMTSASTVTATVNITSATRESLTRVGLPRAIVRGSRLYPRLSVTCATAFWLLCGLTLHTLPQQKRVSR
jgi:hypothetical protein